jgi:hypothetical protein
LNILIYWSGNIEELPSGWDAALEDSVNINTLPKNTICALSANVGPQYQNKGYHLYFLLYFVFFVLCVLCVVFCISCGFLFLYFLFVCLCVCLFFFFFFFPFAEYYILVFFLAFLLNVHVFLFIKIEKIKGTANTSSKE